MLTIQNIGDLIGAQLNDWKVLEACQKQNPQRGEDYYKIVLARLDNKGVMLDDRAGVLIDRNINPLVKGYHIKVVYESWDYEIHTTTWPALTIKGKDAFFGMILYRINEEYYKRNSK
jgi:hypothetical protein